MLNLVRKMRRLSVASLAAGSFAGCEGQEKDGLAREEGDGAVGSAARVARFGLGGCTGEGSTRKKRVGLGRGRLGLGFA